MKPLAALAILALASCATVHSPNLLGRHALLAVDGKALPVPAGMFLDRDGMRNDPGVIASGFIDLQPSGRYEFYHEYRSARSDRVLARDQVRGSYRVAGDRLTLVGDPHPSGKPVNWTGKVGRASFIVHYDGSDLTFQR